MPSVNRVSVTMAPKDVFLAIVSLKAFPFFDIADLAMLFYIIVTLRQCQ